MDKSFKFDKKTFIIGTLAGLARSCIVLDNCLKKVGAQGASSQNHNSENLGMERYEFILASDEGTIEAVVEQAGDCYSVNLNGKYAGTMWQDESKGMQWKTEDKNLEPNMWEISVHLSEAFSRKGFPSLLMGTYPEILATDWKTSETLEVILKENTDMEVFTAFLKDEVLNLVTFEEHLDLIIKKENDAYFVIVGIN
ncbi:hypothetical protein [Pedobacter suwonensis]|uniref:hypothetical protein n=2 Tax=Pedobacter TaxID=84567 RepID=UPI00119D3C4E|nr:hypothetical protein [Pedobacter suwonensis]